MAKRQISKKPLYRKWVRVVDWKWHDGKRVGQARKPIKCSVCCKKTAFDKFNGLVVCLCCVLSWYNAWN